MTKQRLILASVLVLSTGSVAVSAPGQRFGARHERVAVQSDRPLTIGPRHGIYRRGNDIVAPGGFSAYGYGYPAATPDDRRAAYNAHLRDVARLYGSGVDGIGGWGFDGDREAGYTNPAYGNTFSRSVGYNGVPTHLAFGPGFANRRLANHDPLEDDEAPGPSPNELGYSTSPDE